MPVIRISHFNILECFPHKIYELAYTENKKGEVKISKSSNKLNSIKVIAYKRISEAEIQAEMNRISKGY